MTDEENAKQRKMSGQRARAIARKWAKETAGHGDKITACGICLPAYVQVAIDAAVKADRALKQKKARAK